MLRTRTTGEKFWCRTNMLYVLSVCMHWLLIFQYRWWCFQRNPSFFVIFLFLNNWQHKTLPCSFLQQQNSRGKHMGNFFYPLLVLRYISVTMPFLVSHYLSFFFSFLFLLLSFSLCGIWSSPIVLVQFSLAPIRFLYHTTISFGFIIFFYFATCNMLLIFFSSTYW